MSDELATGEFIKAIEKTEIVLTIKGETLDYGSELVDHLTQLQKENDTYRHENNVNQVMDMWPLWKITAIDSFSLKKGSNLDNWIIADKKATDLTAQLDQAREILNKSFGGNKIIDEALAALERKS